MTFQNGKLLDEKDERDRDELATMERWAKMYDEWAKSHRDNWPQELPSK
jgi:hypothetical protein